MVHLHNKWCCGQITHWKNPKFAKKKRKKNERFKYFWWFFQQSHHFRHAHSNWLSCQVSLWLYAQWLLLIDHRWVCSFVCLLACFSGPQIRPNNIDIFLIIANRHHYSMSCCTEKTMMMPMFIAIAFVILGWARLGDKWLATKLHDIWRIPIAKQWINWRKFRQNKEFWARWGLKKIRLHSTLYCNLNLASQIESSPMSFRSFEWRYFVFVLITSSLFLHLLCLMFSSRYLNLHKFGTARSLYVPRKHRSSSFA